MAGLPAVACARAAAVIWLVHLHVFWLQHQLQHQAGRPELWARVLGPDAEKKELPLLAARAGISLRPDEADAEASARRYSFAAAELLALAKAGGPAAGAGHRQLGWHYNKAALDLTPLDPATARRAADIAAAGWPYWLSWPETRGQLGEALGVKATATLLGSVRPRFPAALWENWWQPVAVRRFGLAEEAAASGARRAATALDCAGGQSRC